MDLREFDKTMRDVNERQLVRLARRPARDGSLRSTTATETHLRNSRKVRFVKAMLVLSIR